MLADLLDTHTFSQDGQQRAVEVLLSFNAYSHPLIRPQHSLAYEVSYQRHDSDIIPYYLFSLLLYHTKNLFYVP